MITKYTVLTIMIEAGSDKNKVEKRTDDRIKI